MTKTKLVQDLKEYFASKGKFLSYNEYIEAEDAPYRIQVIKRAVGSWARLERMVGMAPVEVAPVAVEPVEVPSVPEAPVEPVEEVPAAPPVVEQPAKPVATTEKKK